MFRLVWLLCVIVGHISTAGADTSLAPGIELSVDADTVYAGDSVMLEIRGVGLIDAIDIAPLSRDADLLSETGGTQIGVIGGRVAEVISRRLEFLPRQEGKVFFGPLRGVTKQGEVQSNALVVTVLPPSDVDWIPGDEDISIQYSVIPAQPVVGERLVADLRLRHRYPIADEFISLPTFDGFDVLPIAEARRTVVEEDGLAWRQIAWRWLLFPLHSGEIAMDSIQWTGEMIRSRTQRGRFDETLTSPVVDVMATSGDDTWWLPSPEVTLTEEWSRDVRELTAGDEFIRTITLTARDVMASQLPDIEPLESRAIRSTLIGTRREQSVTNDGSLIATAHYDFRMQAQSPVPVFLDTVRVAWWNTRTGEPRESIIPARRINVGLPERADLLAGLALKNRGSDRLWLMLESLGRWERLLWVTLSVLVGLLVWLCLSAFRQVRTPEQDSSTRLPSL